MFCHKLNPHSAIDITTLAIGRPRRRRPNNKKKGTKKASPHYWLHRHGSQLWIRGGGWLLASEMCKTHV